MTLLKAKRALVTGGTAGIGRGIALAFAKEGADVAIIGTNKERAASVLAELEQNRLFPEQKFLSYLANVSKKNEIDETIRALLEAWGGVDILVNNAGITKDNLLMRMSEEEWDLVIDVNLKSVYNLCHALVRPMMKARGGKIINISSVIGLTGNAGQANYAASKAGIMGLTKALAQELATRGICVNCIAPGFIDTAMTEGLTDAQKEAILKKIPMGKWGVPQDVAGAALFLASALSDYVTGQVITVDGGMVM